MLPADDRALRRELEVTRALLAQARADRDRLQDAATLSGNRVLELDAIARRHAARAQTAEQALADEMLRQQRTLRGRIALKTGAARAKAARTPMGRAYKAARARRSGLPAAGAEPVAPLTSTGPPTWPSLPEVLCLDVTNLRDPARSGIARVTIRLAQELARRTTVRLVTVTEDRLIRDVSFDEEIFGSPAEDADSHGARVTGGPGVWVFSAAIQRAVELPGWQAEIVRLRAQGARYAQVVHDLLPLQLPDFFDLGMRRRFPQWLGFVTTNADVLFADSGATREALLGWAADQSLPHVDVHVLSLGANPHPAAVAEAEKAARPQLLMVGVVEPRKGVDVVVDAVTELRASGHDLALAVVGRRGWVAVDLIDRLERLSAESDWFTWEEQADDAALQAWYRRGDLLIAASRGEGYGLPLAEALACGLPVLARDIPVFREVVGAGGRYFDLDADLPRAIIEALQQSSPTAPRLPTWRDTATAVLSATRARIHDAAES